MRGCTDHWLIAAGLCFPWWSLAIFGNQTVSQAGRRVFRAKPQFYCGKIFFGWDWILWGLKFNSQIEKVDWGPASRFRSLLLTFREPPRVHIRLLYTIQFYRQEQEVGIYCHNPLRFNPDADLAHFSTFWKDHDTLFPVKELDIMIKN